MMKFSDLFKKKNPQPKQSEPAAGNTVFCTATDCYFNNSFKGVLECELRTVEITADGACRHFTHRKDAAAFFNRKDNKENA